MRLEILGFLLVAAAAVLPGAEVLTERARRAEGPASRHLVRAAPAPVPAAGEAPYPGR